MIGLGISLCGACVMADYDEVTARPNYTNKHTRGHYITGEIRIPVTPSVTSLFIANLSSPTYAGRIKQRAVISCSPQKTKTATFYYLGIADSGDNARNIYIIDTELHVQLPNIVVHIIQDITESGKYDVTCFNGVSTIKHTGNRPWIKSISYKETPGEKALDCRGFVCRPNVAEDARYHLGYACHDDYFVQLIYPMTTAQGRLYHLSGDFSQDNAAIELVNKQAVEI